MMGRMERSPSSMSYIHLWGSESLMQGGEDTIRRIVGGIML